MLRYKVFKNGEHVGDVEALDSSSALARAQDLYQVQLPRDTIKLEREYSYGMRILIDTTNGRAIARHDSAKALAALALIQFANVDTTIILSGQNKSYSVFDAMQLISIAASVGLELDRGAKYSDQIKALRAALEAAEWLTLPYTTAQLEDQAYCLAGSDDRPYAYDPDGNEPKRLKAWHFEPQRNRKRSDSTHWHMFSSGLGYAPGEAPPEAQPTARAGESAGAARKAPPAPSAPRTSAPGKPKAPKPPKAPRAPAAPGPRPKPGTSTGKVWDVADSLWKDSMDLKAFRAALLEGCTAEGINPGTVNVQFSKWKASKGL